jgi:hypothetical protein
MWSRGTWCSCARLTKLIPAAICSGTSPQAGQGKAQIRATVTAKLRRGQARKHYILYDLTRNHVKLHTQCNTCTVRRREKARGRENRESKTSLAQPQWGSNAEVMHRGLSRVLCWHGDFDSLSLVIPRNAATRNLQFHRLETRPLLLRHCRASLGGTAEGGCPHVVLVVVSVRLAT